ncbi:MAG: caspase family protein [Deltaproteobacteria bacterium]|nr:caspase family protein [Deltaproteobacteria bacterium]
MISKITRWLFLSMAACLILGAHAPFTWGTSDCDMALHFFSKGKYSRNQSRAIRSYLKAIELCPGFVRPYELLGNIYRKAGRRDEALEYFTKAAELGTTNYKLYYLLADLLFEKGELDRANMNLKKSLNIRGDYPGALDLKRKIDRASDRAGPRIILFEPAPRRGLKLVYKYRSENITVRGLATDKSGVSWVKINQLDVPVDGRGNFLKDIPIKLGLNTVTVQAADTVGNRSSLSVDVEREEAPLPQAGATGLAPPTRQVYDKSFAVIIGINDYEKWPPLEFAVNDAKAVRQKLFETGFDQITTIFDKEATQRRILTELFHELPRKVHRNDRVIFYFAGHGQTEELPNGGRQGYIVPVDADTSNYSSTAISMEQIRSLSSRITAKHILYVMDSCYSGLGLSRSYGVSPGLSGYLRKVASMRVIQVVTAGGKGEQVQEREGHGLFTTYFLRALDGEADINKDNVVTGTELGAYLRPKVSDASKNAQTPLFGRLEGEGEFLFFLRSQ